MRLLIFGASGRTGREVLKQGLTAGYEMTGYVRDAQEFLKDSDEQGLKRYSETGQLYLIEGEITQNFSLVSSLSGHKYDAAFILIGPKTPIFKAPELVEGVRNIVEVLETGVAKRLLYLSIVSTREDSAKLGPIYKYFAPLVARNLISEHKQKEQIIKEGTLTWTLFQPPFLNEKEFNGRYVVKEHIERDDAQLGLGLRRANLAHVMLSALQDRTTFNKGLFVADE